MAYLDKTRQAILDADELLRILSIHHMGTVRTALREALAEIDAERVEPDVLALEREDWPIKFGVIIGCQLGHSLGNIATALRDMASWVERGHTRMDWNSLDPNREVIAEVHGLLQQAYLEAADTSATGAGAGQGKAIPTARANSDSIEAHTQTIEERTLDNEDRPLPPDLQGVGEMNPRPLSCTCIQLSRPSRVCPEHGDHIGGYLLPVADYWSLAALLLDARRLATLAPYAKAEPLIKKLDEARQDLERIREDALDGIAHRRTMDARVEPEKPLELIRDQEGHWIAWTDGKGSR